MENVHVQSGFVSITQVFCDRWKINDKGKLCAASPLPLLNFLFRYSKTFRIETWILFTTCRYPASSVLGRQLEPPNGILNQSSRHTKSDCSRLWNSILLDSGGWRIQMALPSMGLLVLAFWRTGKSDSLP